MKDIRSMLVAIDPTSDTQPALEAALPLARAAGARLELFACEYRDAQVRYHPIELTVSQQFHDAILRHLRQMLDGMAARAREQGIETTTSVKWAAPYYEEIIARARDIGADLVVKGTRYHGRIRRTLFTGSDWHLIRDCPAPLLLVKEPTWPAKPQILVAVDPLHAHDKPGALDRQLLASAVQLAKVLGGEVHVLHVYALPSALEVIGDAAAIAATTAALPQGPSADDARDALTQLAASASIPAERCHLVVGRPAEGIVDFATQHKIDFVVMGAVSRTRLERFFIGSTAESVLDELECNVLVEKPQV
jgi:universal stress protein E